MKSLLFSVVGLSLVLVTPVLANTADQVLNGFQKTGVNAGFDLAGNAPKKEFIVAFSQYATWLAALMGGLFMLLVIYSGWLWMSARGNEQQVEKAKQILLNATIGLIVVVSARAILEIALTVLENTLPK